MFIKITFLHLERTDIVLFVYAMSNVLVLHLAAFALPALTFEPSPLLRHHDRFVFSLLLGIIFLLVPDLRPSLKHRLPDPHELRLAGVKRMELFGSVVHLYNYRILLRPNICLRE